MQEETCKGLELYNFEIESVVVMQRIFYYFTPMENKKNPNNVNYKLGTIITLILLAGLAISNFYDYYKADNEKSSLYHFVFYVVIFLIILVGYSLKKYQLAAIIALIFILAKSLLTTFL